MRFTLSLPKGGLLALSLEGTPLFRWFPNSMFSRLKLNGIPTLFVPESSTLEAFARGGSA
jgi:hypothetical protein